MFVKFILWNRIGIVFELSNGKNLPIAGHEVDLNINGTPIRIRPLSEWSGDKSRYQLVSVNDEVASKNTCRKLVFKMGAKWVLTDNGHRLADLLATGAGK